MFCDFAQENFSDILVFYLLWHFQKKNQQSLAYILKNMNSIYCYVVKYLRNILHCVIFILRQVWNSLSISQLVFQSYAQLCFPSTDFYRALPFGEKSILCIFPKLPPCTWETSPSQKEFEAQNAYIYLLNRWEIWKLRAVPFLFSFAKKTCYLVRSHHCQLNICCDWIIPTVLIHPCIPSSHLSKHHSQKT